MNVEHEAQLETYDKLQSVLTLAAKTLHATNDKIVETISQIFRLKEKFKELHNESK